MVAGAARMTGWNGERTWEALADCCDEERGKEAKHIKEWQLYLWIKLPIISSAGSCRLAERTARGFARQDGDVGHDSLEPVAAEDHFLEVFKDGHETRF